MRSHTIVMLISVVLLSAGCAGLISPEVARLSVVSYAPLPEGAPVLLSTKDIDREYEEIAVISIRSSAWTSIEELNEALKKEARDIGAHAAIRIQFGHEGM